MTAAPVRVLLVEDDPDDVVLVRATLADAPAFEVELTLVATAADAASRLAAETFDVVLLDLSLPDAQGLESVAAVEPLATDTPLVVLTGLDDEDVALEAMHGGAQDYLVKSRVTAELLVRSIRYARERHRLLAERTRHLERELEVAALLQRASLPADIPAPDGFDVGAYLHASGRIGGDFYDFVPLATGEVAIAVGDASGKGIPGALLMATAQGSLRAEVDVGRAPVDVIGRVNGTLCRSGGRGRFVTLFYAVLDPAHARLRYVSAGHPKAFLYADAATRALSSTGPPLGLFADAAFTESAVQLADGDQLVIYSDGVSEAQSRTGRFFDEVGIHDTVGRQPDAPATILSRAICEAAERFERGNPEPGDDKTVVVVRAGAIGR